MGQGTHTKIAQLVSKSLAFLMKKFKFHQQTHLRCQILLRVQLHLQLILMERQPDAVKKIKLNLEKFIKININYQPKNVFIKMKILIENIFLNLMILFRRLI